MHCSQERSQARAETPGLQLVTGARVAPGRSARGTSAPAGACAALTLFTYEQLPTAFEGSQSQRTTRRFSRGLSLTAGGKFAPLSSLVQHVDNTNPPGEVRTGETKGRNSGSGTETGCSALHGVASGPCRWRFSPNHETTVSTKSVLEVADLLTLTVAARRLAVCRRTLERLIAAGKFPRPVKVGAATRVPVSDLQAYLAQLLAQRGAAS